MNNKKNLLTVFFSFLIILLTTIIIYYPGIKGGFILDDEPNLERLNNYGGATASFNGFMSYVFGGHAGKTSRPVSLLSFLINDNAWPGDPASYKLTNILIHTLNSILVFILGLKLFRYSSLKTSYQYFAALSCMGLWALHPMNVSTVLYVIQRMTELSALFSLLAVISYLKFREIYFQVSQQKGLLLLTLVTLPIIAFSFLSKENGIVTLLFIVVLELTILDYPKQSPLIKYWLNLFIYIPIVIVIGYFIFFWDAHNSFIYRNHTMLQHLMTESRILMEYLTQFFFPSINKMGLFHDDFQISKDIVTPVSTLFSILFIVALITLSFIKRKKYPFIAFAILWFFSGHIIESSFLPLELYFEHRNYLPYVGLCIGTVYFLVSSLPKVLKRINKTVFFIIPTILLIFSFQTWSLASLWGDKGFQLALSHKTHPDSMRATIHYTNHLMETGNPATAISTLESTLNKHPNLNLFFSYLNFYCGYYSSIPMDKEKIFNQVSSLHYKGIISHQVQSFSETLLRNNCEESPVSFLNQIYNSLEENKYLKNRKGDLARIYYLHSDIAHAKGELQKAISLLDKAYALQPTVDIALRQIDLLIKARQYKIAMYYLEQAKKANLNRKLFTSNRKKEINTVETFLTRKLNDNKS